MKSAYDDLSQEMWGRADDDMPKEYLDDVLAQIEAIQPSRPRPAESLDSIQQMVAVKAKTYGRQRPREGQPAFDAPLIEWYRESQLRMKLFAAELESHIRA